MAIVPLNDPRNQVVTVITVPHCKLAGTTFCDAPRARVDLSGVPSKPGVWAKARRLA
mgnify:CR=1 FL=1